jgi:hypothetical protein
MTAREMDFAIIVLKPSVGLKSVKIVGGDIENDPKLRDVING